MKGLVRVKDSQTGKLKRFEFPDGHTLAEVNGTQLVVTKVGLKHGYSANGLTLMQNGSRAW